MIDGYGQAIRLALQLLLAKWLDILVLVEQPVSRLLNYLSPVSLAFELLDCDRICTWLCSFGAAATRTHVSRCALSHTYLFIFSIISPDKLKEVEDATGYHKVYFFVAISLVMMAVLTLIGGAKLMVDLLGFVYPAYMSFKSMDG